MKLQTDWRRDKSIIDKSHFESIRNYNLSCKWPTVEDHKGLRSITNIGEINYWLSLVISFGFIRLSCPTFGERLSFCMHFVPSHLEKVLSPRSGEISVSTCRWSKRHQPQQTFPPRIPIPIWWVGQRKYGKRFSIAWKSKETRLPLISKTKRKWWPHVGRHLVNQIVPRWAPPNGPDKWIDRRPRRYLRSMVSRSGRLGKQ